MRTRQLDASEIEMIWVLLPVKDAHRPPVHLDDAKPVGVEPRVVHAPLDDLVPRAEDLHHHVAHGFSVQVIGPVSVVGDGGGTL